MKTDHLTLCDGAHSVVYGTIHPELIQMPMESYRQDVDDAVLLQRNDHLLNTGL